MPVSVEEARRTRETYGCLAPKLKATLTTCQENTNGPCFSLFVFGSSNGARCWRRGRRRRPRRAAAAKAALLSLAPYAHQALTAQGCNLAETEPSCSQKQLQDIPTTKGPASPRPPQLGLLGLGQGLASWCQSKAERGSSKGGQAGWPHGSQQTRSSVMPLKVVKVLNFPTCFETKVNNDWKASQA